VLYPDFSEPYGPIEKPIVCIMLFGNLKAKFEKTYDLICSSIFLQGAFKYDISHN
jgi:hypothetical protein